MDVTSLPDEMLANVLKYSHFNAVRHLREINQRLDRVSKKADIGIRVPVVYFRYWRRSITVSFSNDFYEGENSFKIPSGAAIMPTLTTRTMPLAAVISKVNLTRGLVFRNSLIDDELIALLDKNKRSLKGLKVITICSSILEISSEKSKYLLRRICPNVENLIINSMKTQDLAKICNSEVLVFRQWKRIHFSWGKRRDGYQLDEAFLLTMAPKCEYFDITDNNKFTVAGAITLLQKCQYESELSHTFHLGNIELGNIHPDRIELTLKEKFTEVNVLKSDIWVFFGVAVISRAGKQLVLTFEVNFNGKPVH